MSRLNELLKVVEQANPQLAIDLRKEYAALSKRRAFGLNFERHAPESVELPGRPVRAWDKVRVLPPRGSTTSARDNRTWTVLKLSAPGKNRTATIAENVQPGIDAKPEVLDHPLDELVVVAESTDKIYPGLVSTGSVTRGEDRPFHAVINAENLDALRTLIFTHAGKVDAIYIDPPYNTGARDWKYNNDYVDGEDGYRHSKWLAFMERRLKLAKRLLNPDDSTMIVTIDEKEYLRLGLLLEQTFPGASIQMVSVAINPAPPARNGLFGRADEFYYFVLLGAAAIRPTVLPEDWFTAKGRTHRGEIRWDLLRKSGASPTREGHPDTFYPFFISDDGRQFHSVGDPIGVGALRHDVVPPDGTFAAWPIRQDGSEGRWRLQPSTARAVLAEGGLRIGAPKGESTPIYYLAEGEREKIATGIYEVLDRRPDGSVVTSLIESGERRIVPSTQWRIPAHDSTQYGSRLLAKLLPDRKFPFPKSLYAVEDALRFAVAHKPDGLIVDFFAGSGTTAHAVMRLNRQDGGSRRSISVTNNEVSADEQAALRNQSLRPGDPQWEALGICDYITKPRIYAAVTGETPDGAPVSGEYKFTDEFPMADGFEENVEFFTLTYEAPRPVAQNKSFASIAPLLWLRAGGEGRRIDNISGPFDVADTYGILFDLDHSRQFLEAVTSNERLRIAYVVTDDEPAFQTVAEGLGGNVEAVRLYEAYLTNFRYNAGVES